MTGARRIRLLFVVGNFVAGGAERHLLELWRRLDRDRFDVRIACFRREGQFLDDVERTGWPVIDLRLHGRLYGLAGVRAFARLVHEVLSFRPQVIHGYLFGPNLLAVLAGRLCGVPAVVVAKRNVDAFESPRQIAVQRFAHRHATHVTAVSETVARTAEDLGVDRARITVIPNGVDASRFTAPALDRREFALAEDVPVIGSVGCLAPRKDYGNLFDALARMPAAGRGWQLLLVGDGVDREPLERRARELGLDGSVRFAGERADVERLLPMMDVFVLPSREEGIPNALLEAMAAGRPSVATAVGGTPEVLQDGVTGWLVPAQDPDALARALEEVLAHPLEAARRGEAARRHALAELSIDAMARRHEVFYELVSGGPGDGRG